MDYLKAFTIGTSGLVWFQHMALLALKDKKHFEYSEELYSILAPIYYGLMSMLSLYFRKKYNWSLKESLLITSIISIVFIVLFNYFISRKKYKPYKNYTRNEWLTYILQNGARHLIAFNIIIYFLENNFSTNKYIKYFVIGSSIFSYLITFLKIQHLNKKGNVNYDYRMFATGEPFIQGFFLMLSLFLLHDILNINMNNSLSIITIGGAIGWVILAYILKTYKYTFNEWVLAFSRVLITSIVKYKTIIPYLLKNL